LHDGAHLWWGHRVQTAKPTKKRKKAPTCDGCFFRQNLLCALELDAACPTFRPNCAEGLTPPRQLRFAFRTEARTNTAWTFPTATEQAALAR
jgi:hypothetical protein